MLLLKLRDCTLTHTNNAVLIKQSEIGRFPKYCHTHVSITDRKIFVESLDPMTMHPNNI